MSMDFGTGSFVAASIVQNGRTRSFEKTVLIYRAEQITDDWGFDLERKFHHF